MCNLLAGKSSHPLEVRDQTTNWCNDGNERNLTWVQQRLFLEVVQLLREVIMGVIVQVVADVIEKQYKLTTLYMIRTAIQLKEIQRSAYTVCLILAKVNQKIYF